MSNFKLFSDVHISRTSIKLPQLNARVRVHLSKTEYREPSFVKMISHLYEADNPLIVETGCVRSTYADWSAGMSTVLFDYFINDFKGEFHSIDLSEDSIQAAKSLVSEKTQLHCEDSVKFLREQCLTWNKQGRQITLLYLDSYDFFPEVEHESSLHHIFELLAASPAIGPGSMIAVDDNYENKGKGFYVKKYMEHIGVPLFHDGFQLIWIMP